jgi:hypothetical protein
MTRFRLLLTGLGAGLATAILLLATEPKMAIVWDEGFTLGREQRLRAWFRAMWDPAAFAIQWKRPRPGEELLMPDGTTPPRHDQVDSWSKLLWTPRVVDWFWPFAREEPHGHPPFYALVGLLGDLVAPSWEELPRARLGPILLFSLASGAISSVAATRWGHWAAAASFGAWALQPNLFGLAHYASYDGVLTSLWALAILVFPKAVALRPGRKRSAIRWCWTVTLGVILGSAAATKVTGWFLPIPFLVWAGIYRDKRALLTLAVGLVVSALLIYAILPPWWTHPADSLVRFLRSNMTRGTTIPIPICFLHHVYDTPTESLPWYNTLVWTALVTPLGFLILAALGIARALRYWQNDSFALLIALHWAFLMVLRSLPHTPGHDGVRLFLPAFGVLALLAGLGARFLLDRLCLWSKVAIAAALLEGVISVFVMMPVPLSYFSPLAGGLPGATALGMEPTYYWDALSPSALRWLRENTPPGRTIDFYSFAHSFLYRRQTGELPPQLAGVDPGEPLWYVVQNRPGNLSDADQTLIAQGRPAYVVRKFGVPLLWVFPCSEFQRLKLERRRFRADSRTRIGAVLHRESR